MSYPPIISESTVETVAPDAEPVTLAEAKLHCRIDNDAEDTLLAEFITSAREYCETFTERSFAQRTLVTRFSGFPLPGQPMFLPRCPLISVTSLKHYDASNDQQTISSGDYVVRTDTTPGSIEMADGEAWPDTFVRGDAVEATYVAGYGALVASCPRRAKLAIRMLVGHWYENREAASVGVDVREIPMAVTAILWSLRTGVLR